MTQPVLWLSEESRLRQSLPCRGIMQHRFAEQEMHRAAIFLSCLVLGGCFAVAAGTYGKHRMAREQFGLEPVRNEFSFDEARYSESEVVALWGEPNSREEDDRCVVLGYENGRAWSGAGVFVGIAPIPVGVPNGRYWNYIYLRDDQTVGAVIEFGDVKNAVGVTCGSNECGAVAGDAENSDSAQVESDINRWCADAA